MNLSIVSSACCEEKGSGTVLRSARSARRGARSRSGRVLRAPTQRSHLAGDGQGPVHIEKGEGLPGLLALRVGHRRGYVSRADCAAEDWRAHPQRAPPRENRTSSSYARGGRHGSLGLSNAAVNPKSMTSSMQKTHVPILKTGSLVKEVCISLVPFYHPHTPGSRDRDPERQGSLLVDALLLRTLLPGRSLQPPHSPSNPARRTSPIHPERQHVHSGVH